MTFATLQQVRQYTLIHPISNVCYDFYPRGGEVDVVHQFRARVDRYTVPLEEARLLWRFLTNKGYERF